MTQPVVAQSMYIFKQPGIGGTARFSASLQQDSSFPIKIQHFSTPPHCPLAAFGCHSSRVENTMGASGSLPGRITSGLLPDGIEPQVACSLTASPKPLPLPLPAMSRWRSMPGRSCSCTGKLSTAAMRIDRLSRGTRTRGTWSKAQRRMTR